MLETVKEFSYKKLSPEEMESRHILGRLVGPIADFKHPTRNDRLYSEDVWDKTFESPIMKEKLENKCILGELGHPEDRTETLIEKAAICLAEMPKKLTDGTLQGVFDILDTPNGKILKTLCDYGCKIGVSSRGTGDIYEGLGGQEEVLPDTYECECWDAVLLPSVKAARPKYVTESLKKALTESLSKASDKEKEIMKETLDSLNFDYSPEKVNNIEDVESQSQSANDDGDSVIRDLQDSLLREKSLQAQITALQEKLSVCYTKEASLREDIERYKKTIISLSDSAKEAKSTKIRINSLIKESQDKDNQISDLQKRLKYLTEQKSTFYNSNKSLNESIADKTNTINKLKEDIDKLKQDFNQQELSLKEENAALKKDLAIKNKEYMQKLDKGNKLVETYKSIASESLAKYIESKALNIGVSSDEIRDKLPQNYSFTDIDRICESLREYKINISKLPFNVTSKQKNIKMTVTENMDKLAQTKKNMDDTVDDMLIQLAGLNSN